MAKPPPPEPVTRKSVTLPNSMWEEVAAFRVAERIGSEAEAVRQLVQAALRDHAKKAKAPKR